MDINFDEYRLNLDRDLAAVTGRNLGAATSPVLAPNLQAPTMDQPATNLADEHPGMGAIGGQSQKPKVPIFPDGMQLEFDEKKLERAQALPDYVDAMKPTSRNKYMNWYEQQYGAINDQYNNMLQQIGEKPDPDRKLSRKEKWTALMEFGINLIKSSQSVRQGGQGDNLGAALAVAAGETVAGTQARRQGEVSQFAEKRAMVESGRQGAMKNLGSYGDAMTAQSNLDRSDAITARELAEMARQKRLDDANAPDTVSSDQGIFRWDAKLQDFVSIKDEQGRKLTNLKVGSRGGIQPDTRPAEQKKYEHLISLGLSKDAATRIAYRQSSGDPVKDYKDVYRTAMSSNFGNAKKAKEVADSFIGFVYGDGAISEAQKNIVPDTSPTGAPRKVSTQAEYNALPSGTKYIAPDGSTRTKK